MSKDQDTILEVEGMTCPSCVRAISSALGELDGIGKVDVELREGLVRVKHDSRATLARMIETLTNVGYATKAR